MNAKYAIFIWSSYALAAVVLLWNLIVPRLRRNDLYRQLAAESELESFGEAMDGE